MATLPKAGAVTLLDAAKAMDPDGTVAVVAELLSQTNEMLIDMPFKEGNLPTGHQSSMRNGLPATTFRKMYNGVDPGKSLRVQVTDTCGNLEARSEVDKDVANLNGNLQQFRMSEADAFIEAMNQTFAQTVFYGDATANPERFHGLAPRYSSLSAGNAQNIIDAGGTGSNNSSVWLIGWGENTVCGIYPKGTKAGLSHEDLGLIDALDSTSRRFRAYADVWNWKGGVCVPDWRYAVRICNINMTDMVGQTGTQAASAATALPKLMIKAMARIPQMGKARCAFYANRTIKEMLSIAALEKSSSALGIRDASNQFGEVAPGSVNNGMLNFLGIPVRTSDALLSTEARVT